MTDHVAHAEVDIAAPAGEVWDALTDPTAIARFMFGAKVETDWEEGSPITWTGEYDGTPFQDKGEIVEVVPNERLRMTHFSPLTGEDDEPENYHTLVYALTATEDGTHLELTQDGNDSEEQAEQFSQNWQSMLDGLKQHVES